MTQTTAAPKPTRKAGWTPPPMPRKKPLTIEQTDAAIAIIEALEILFYVKADDYEFAITPDMVIPTGDENARLMVDVLSYASWEEAVSNGRSKSRFDMTDWVKGIVKREKPGTPPPLTCGTAACLAGTAASFRLAEDEFLYGHEVLTAPLDVIKGLSINSSRYEFRAHSTHVEDIEERGASLLGLTPVRAKMLFLMTTSTLDEIKLVASYIFGRDLTGVTA